MKERLCCWTAGLSSGALNESLAGRGTRLDAASERKPFASSADAALIRLQMAEFLKLRLQPLTRGVIVDLKQV